MTKPAVLAIAAHPDDIEMLMAGTLLRLAERGWDLHYCNLANGCNGTTQYDREAIIRMRAEEGRAAAEQMGATFHPSICDDLGIFYDDASLRKVAAIVRRAKPRIVLTHAPVDYMEDHMNACRLALTAAFARGMPNFVTDPPEPPFASPVAVYHAQPYTHRDGLGRVVHPGLYVDVSDVVERKVELLALHKSQKDWLDESQGLDSYLQTLRDLDAECGRMSTLFQYAEGWRRHNPMGYGPADDDPLLEALPERAFPAPKQERAEF
ncbi:MAG TPA: PIG-L family deacetylase [Pirellulaceae bacterium]|jgi:LmbE family N-acetylglucosaminyl deacetylase|nr:PIG-L family deacetylase [Pirellulaceae bacterium]